MKKKVLEKSGFITKTPENMIEHFKVLDDKSSIFKKNMTKENNLLITNIWANRN